MTCQTFPEIEQISNEQGRAEVNAQFYGVKKCVVDQTDKPQTQIYPGLQKNKFFKPEESKQETVKRFDQCHANLEPTYF